MLISDLHSILIWWLATFLISLLFLPLIFSLFQKFWDRGYIFSKTLSFFGLSYFLLVGGIFKLLPFTIISIVITSCLIVIFDYIFLKSHPKVLHGLVQKIPIFIFEEFLFLLILALWSYVRAFAPNIEGLEKFMDWGFINSILRSQYFPPKDMWYALRPINYYYFGHLVFALITKISGLSSAITYNLSVATLCSLTFVSTFSLSSNLVYFFSKRIKFRHYFLAGLLSALLLSFGGNLHLAYKVGKSVLIDHQTIQEATNTYWYPDATRFIGFDPDTNDKTIHEFPIYSFVVADLHGHMNDIPLVIFFMAFLFVSLSSRISLLSPQLYLPAAFILSLAYMTNAWDFAVYGLLLAIAYLIISKNFSKTVFSGLLTILFWFIFTLPFSLNFTPMTEGLRLSDTHSPFYQLFVLYGGFWLISLPFVISIFKKIFHHPRQKLLLPDLFILSLLLTATLLVIIPEVIYIKDIYIFEYRRANTMFKLVYQAFIMYSLASGYIFFRLKKHSWYRILFIIIFTIQISYAYYATKSYYGFQQYRGLWGLNFLQDSYPDNLRAIDWLNANVTGQPNIVEAPGDSYTTFDQVSVATGLPTIEGWLVHEWLWRGGYDAPAARQAEVDQIYTSDNLDEVKSLLQKYQIKYVIVGSKEYEKYPNLNANNFLTIGATLVFESGQTKIYQLN